MIINKVIYMALALLIFSNSYAQIQCTVSGESKFAKEGDHAFLYYLHKDGFYEDTVKLNGGKFTFLTDVRTAREAQLRIGPLKSNNPRQRGPGLLGFYLEQGKVLIALTDPIANSTVIGNVENKVYALYRKAMAEPEAEEQKVIQILKAASPEKQKSKIFQDSIMTLFKPVNEKFRLSNKAFIVSHPNSIVSLWLVKSMTESPAFEFAAVQPLYDLFPEQLKKTTVGIAIAAAIDKKKNGIEPGKMAPVFQLPDTSGKIISLQDYREGYVFLDFWASWCVPCRAENPHVLKAYQAYKDKGFDVLGVSLDVEKDKKKWIQAIKDDRLIWKQVSDLKGWQSQVVSIYGIEGIPQNYLIDPTGKVIAKNLRGEALMEKLKDLLGQ